MELRKSSFEGLLQKMTCKSILGRSSSWLVILLLTQSCSAPTDSKMLSLFYNNQASFKHLLSMFIKDQDIKHISVTTLSGPKVGIIWVDSSTDWSSAGLTKDRWKEYQESFSQLKLYGLYKTNDSVSMRSISGDPVVQKSYIYFANPQHFSNSPIASNLDVFDFKYGKCAIKKINNNWYLSICLND